MVPAEPAQLRELLAGDGWLWIDLVDEQLSGLGELAAMLDLEEIDVDDILHETEYPKLETRHNYLFLIAHTTSRDETRLRTVEVDLVLGRNYLVTVRREDTPGVGALREHVTSQAPHGPDELMAIALELIGRRILPLLGVLDEMIYDLEDRALAGDPTVPQQVQALRRDAIRLRRAIAPQRDAQDLLAKDETHITHRAVRRRFTAGYDDSVRIVDSLDTARALLGAVLDTYRATVAERMNEVMKVLTVFSAIVLPLGLIAGIYGMNFINIPGAETSRGFLILVGAMLVIAVGLWAYFVQRRFIGGPRLPRVDRVVGKGLAGFVHLTLVPVRLVGKALQLDESSGTGPNDS